MSFEILSLAFSLFLLMDPIGNIPIFISVLNKVPKERRKKIIVREMMISLMIIVIFAFAGEKILNLLHITQPTLSISGGILLFIISLKMIFSSALTLSQDKESFQEPFIVPLAVPLIAGPSILASVMIYTKKQPNPIILLIAIFTAWVLSFFILIASDELKRILKEHTLKALESLMGLILTMIAIQMFLEGLEAFWQTF